MYEIQVWLANCEFAHHSSGFSFLIPFCNAPSGGSFHPFHCRAGPPAWIWRRPFPRHLTRGANAEYNRVTASSHSRLVSMATTLSSPIPNTGGRLTFQRLSLVAVSGQRRHKHPMKSYAVCVLIIVCSAFRGSDRFTATVSIRQRQVQLA
jgi:hypothetical protein